MADSNLISLPDVGAALAALGALSTAAFGLVDFTKAFWGGASNLGLGHIRKALTPFDAPLTVALGADGWWPVVRTNWISGVAKADQKAKAQALIKLGLDSSNTAEVAAASHVSARALATAVRNLETGKKLSEQDMNVLGRMNATIDALLDAAFEAADQQYRNVSRFLAAGISAAITLSVWGFWKSLSSDPQPSFLAAVAVGVLAVPLAPVAKDLTGALSAAMTALKAAKKL